MADETERRGWNLEGGAKSSHHYRSKWGHFRLAHSAGLRLGEAAALRVDDIDFLRRQVHVSRQVQRLNGGALDIRLPKYNSERTVHIPDAPIEMLAQHVALGLCSDWLFAGVEDVQPHQNTVGYRWRTTLCRAGVEGVRLHDLRHFFASGPIASGCDVVAVQRALGHAKSTTTLTVYAHLWPTAEDRCATPRPGLPPRSPALVRAP